MQLPFLLQFESWQLGLALFTLMFLTQLLGFYTGKKIQRGMEKENTALGSLFALLGLLLAFTFSMAVNRYDARRQIIVEESNDIGTAILRADLYSDTDRIALRADFKDYLEQRILFFEAGTDVDKIVKAQKDANDISQKLWNRVTQLSRIPKNQVASMQMIPALNAMIDVTNTRWYNNLAYIPEPVIFLLYILACACSFYMGFFFGGKGKIDWMSVVGFCLFTSIVVSIVFDIDRPRRGLITLEATNQSIIDLRSNFTEGK